MTLNSLIPVIRSVSTLMDHTSVCVGTDMAEGWMGIAAMVSLSRGEVMGGKGGRGGREEK